MIMNELLQKFKRPSHTAYIIVMYGSVIVLSAHIHTASALSQEREVERVKMGEVVAIDYDTSHITIKASTTYIVGEYTEETLLYHGSGAVISKHNIQLGQIVYLFGIVSNTTTDIKINKIVVRNTSKLLRKTYTSGVPNFSLFNTEKNKVSRSITYIDNSVIDRIKKSITDE